MYNFIKSKFHFAVVHYISISVLPDRQFSSRNVSTSSHLGNGWDDIWHCGERCINKRCPNGGCNSSPKLILDQKPLTEKIFAARSWTKFKFSITVCTIYESSNGNTTAITHFYCFYIYTQLHEIDICIVEKIYSIVHICLNMVLFILQAVILLNTKYYIPNSPN